MEIILRRVECIATYGEVREEPCLMWRIDGDTEHFGRMCLAPGRGMRAGSTVDVDVQLTVERSIDLRITERDSKYHTLDDCMGTYNLVPGDRESEDPVSGSAYLDFPTTDRSKRHYRLYYDWFLDEEGEEEPWFCLHLLDIHCRNAQEWKDYMFIKVNGVTVWGPTRMRDTGDASQKSVDQQINVRRNSIISLWEQDGDGNRSDHFGSHRLFIGEDYDFDRGPETIRFHYDRHGDATYDLRYQVSRQCV